MPATIGRKNIFQVFCNLDRKLNFLPLYDNQPAPDEIIAFLNRHGLSLVDLYEKCRREQRLAWCTALFRKIPQ